MNKRVNLTKDQIEALLDAARNRNSVHGEGMPDLDSAVKALSDAIADKSKLEQAADGTKVGHRVTKNHPSDCYPYEVVEVVSPKCVLVRSMGYKVVSGSMQDGSAVVEVFPNPEGKTMKVSLRKDGLWRTKGENMGGIPWGWHGARFYQAPEV